MTWSVGAGLEGRGVILTGAAGGIGSAVARGFASAGAKVMAVDLDQARLDDLVGSLDGSGHVAAVADLSDLGHPRSARRAGGAGTRWAVRPGEPRRRPASPGLA